MRIATMIISLTLMLVVGAQSCAMGLGVAALQTKAAEQGWPIGLFVAFLFLIGGAFALVFPFVCVLAFFAGLMGLAGGASNSFGDLTVWGVVSLILAVLSYFGWREKRKRRREEAARVVCQPVHPTLQNRRSPKFGCRPLGAANLSNNI